MTTQSAGDPRASERGTGQAGSILKRFTRASLTYGLGGFLKRGLGFLLIPIYTNYLTPAEYGIVGVVLAIFSAFTVIFGLGLRGAITRQYFEHADEPRRLSRYIGSVYTFFLVYGALGAGLLSIVGREVVEEFLASMPFVPFVPLSLWAAFFAAAGGLVLSLYRAREQAGRYVTFEILSGLFLVAGVVVFVVLRDGGAVGQALGLVGGSFATFALASSLILRESRPRLDAGMIRSAVAFGAPLTVHLLAGWVLLAADRLILARLVPLADLGVYTLGYQLGMIVGAVASALNAAWTPIFYDTVRNREGASRSLGQLASINLSLSIGAALIVILFARELVAILGGDVEYRRAAGVIPIIALGYTLQGVYFVLVTPIFYAQRTVLLPPLTATAAGLNIVLNLLFIPILGIAGAAWATLVAFGVLAVGTGVVAHKQFMVYYEVRKLAGLVIVLLLGALIAPALASLPTAAEIGVKLLIVAVFAATIALTGIASRRRLGQLLR
ncbi:MAG: oligosaccharide flippase family protein [Longimicrobiales bacterium]